MSQEAYLVGLESRLDVEPVTPLNRARVVQLFAGTSQFNLTGIRYSAGEIARRGGAGDAVFLAARLADRLGDSGLVTAVALGRTHGGGWHIENMVLSGQACGRHVENAVIGLIVRRAAELEVTAVTARFLRTADNGRFAGLYPRLGFREAAGGLYRHDLADLPAPVPWLEVTEHPEVFPVP